MIPTPVLPRSHDWRTAINYWRAPLVTTYGFEALPTLGPGLVWITSLDPARPPQRSEQRLSRVVYLWFWIWKWFELELEVERDG